MVGGRQARLGHARSGNGRSGFNFSLAGQPTSIPSTASRPPSATQRELERASPYTAPVVPGLGVVVMSSSLETKLHAYALGLPGQVSPRLVDLADGSSC